MRSEKKPGIVALPADPATVTSQHPVSGSASQRPSRTQMDGRSYTATNNLFPVHGMMQAYRSIISPLSLEGEGGGGDE